MRENHMSNPCGHARVTLAIKQRTWLTGKKRLREHCSVKEMAYSEMRSKQEEVVGHFLSGRDVFVSLPTGSGKSFLRR